jgi:hypothetical protein
MYLFRISHALLISFAFSWGLIPLFIVPVPRKYPGLLVILDKSLLRLPIWSASYLPLVG